MMWSESVPAKPPWSRDRAGVAQRAPGSAGDGWPEAVCTQLPAGGPGERTGGVLMVLRRWLVVRGYPNCY